MNASNRPADPDRTVAIERSVRELQQALLRLGDRVLALEGRAPAESAGRTATTATDEPDRSLSWTQHSGALRRLATICFVLVLALVLRTLTDGGIVGQAVGVWLGVAYAVLLLLAGWRRFAADRAGKRVFTICGALLLCALVLETHSRFGYLPGTAAHGLLGVAILTSAVLGVRHGSPTVVDLGVLAGATTAIAVGFPRPEFHLAAITLLLALAAATVAPRRQVPWLPWAVLVLLLFFWLLWGFKLHAVLARGEELPPGLRPSWYLPELALTLSAVLAIAWRTSRRQPGLFANALPTGNVALACAAAGAVVPWLASPRGLGVAALAVAGLHALLAVAAGRRNRGTSPAAAGFAFAAILAFVPGLWLTTANPTVALAAIGLAALGVAAWSARLQSGGLRAAAGGLQLGALGGAIAGGLFAVPADQPWVAAALGGALATLAALQHRWTRRVPPPSGSSYARLSPADVPGGALLWAALAALFCGLRVAVHPLLATLPIDVDNAFAASQSIMLNVMAIVITIQAWRRQDRVVLRRAVVIAAIGGAKVFASDLLTLRGVPLVLSVFSFGVAAAAGSFVLSRWQRPGEDALRT